MSTSEVKTLQGLAREYFVRADAGRSEVTDLFADDIEIFFPKFGIARGKAAFWDLAKGLLGSISSLVHDMDKLSYITSGETVVVEGTTHGALRSGQTWAGGETPGGRFCSVFQFRDGLISRMYIYLDPDYGSADAERFLWGRDKARRW
jgi:ketosteroid isomerase-like protein